MSNISNLYIAGILVFNEIVPLNRHLGFSPFHIQFQLWILSNINPCVSVKVVPGAEYLTTQTTVVLILPNMTLHVSLFVVPGDELLGTRSTVISILLA